MKKIIWIIVIIIGAIIAYLISQSALIGWLYGWFFCLVLKWIRQQYYMKLFDMEQFSMAKYAGYLIFVMAWIAIPLGISFYFRDVIDPLAVFAAYFIDRLLMYATGIVQPKPKEE